LQGISQSSFRLRKAYGAKCSSDALNEVFVQLWDQSGRFIAEKGLHGFLVTMARRRALDRLRRRLAYHRTQDRFEIELKATYANEMRAHDCQPPNSDLAIVPAPLALFYRGFGRDQAPKISGMKAV
jgi:DNA-directed RNA polymerase specialized sigma24 family protein